MNNALSTIPLRIVSVTSLPARYAPVNSKIVAINTAVLSDIALEPTEVAIAFSYIICTYSPSHK